MVFVEVKLVWPGAKPPGTSFDAAGHLNQVNDYIVHQVHAFLQHQPGAA
jgi:hypothetical protein